LARLELPTDTVPRSECAVCPSVHRLFHHISILIGVSLVYQQSCNRRSVSRDKVGDSRPTFGLGQVSQQVGYHGQAVGIGRFRGIFAVAGASVGASVVLVTRKPLVCCLL
jgi:hypothetical protein